MHVVKARQNISKVLIISLNFTYLSFMLRMAGFFLLKFDA